MEGNNTLELNVATMKAAVQYYLDSCVLREGVAVEVIDVKTSNSAFIVSLRSAPKDK